MTLTMKRVVDYPLGFVRWTEQRNFEAILDMMADGRIDMKPLISHRYKLDDACDAYELISSGNPLGVLLEYDVAEQEATQQVVELNPSANLPAAGARPASIGFIGAGNYASSVLVPAFAATGARLKSIASATGVSSVHVGKKNGIEEATTDTNGLISDPDVDALVISTRHNSHAKQVCAGLKESKHIFVEKPLVLTRDELTEVTEVYNGLEKKPLLMVGFNRRYAPHVIKIKQLLSSKSSPISMVMTVNAGFIPADHWVHDPASGGGRIIGEACHFVDLLRFLADASIESVNAVAMDSQCNDSVSIQLRFKNGSIGVVNYLANGSKSLAKERLEVFCNGAVLQLDNFRALRGYGWSGFKSDKLWRQDKGQKTCTKAFVDAIASGDDSQLISFSELSEVTLACLDIMDQIG